jgi:hypothetical protein
MDAGRTFGNWDAGLVRFARWLNGDSAPIGPRRMLLFGAPALAGAALAAWLLVPQVGHELQRLRDQSISAPIPASAWRVLHSDPVSDRAGCGSDPRCPADIDGGLFEREGKPRDSAHFEALRWMEGKSYWVGTILPPELLARARRAGADQLRLGYLFGTHEVWLGGRRVRTSAHEPAQSSIKFVVPTEILASQKPVLLAIRMVNDAGEAYPDYLDDPVGFATPEEADAVTRAHAFGANVPSSISVGFDLAMGLFFLALWACAVRKQELGAFSAFAFLQASVQAQLLPVVWQGLGSASSYKLIFVLGCYESVFALILGAALSRIR